MSVLIKGMEMPQNCDDCRLNNGITCYAVLEYTEDDVVGRTDDRPDWCPLVPVPKHGRLIDADKIWLTDFEIILCQKGNPFKNALEMLFEKINNAPTIIPAENLAKTIGKSQDSHEIEEGE